jgi:8-oxo-dGTP pyrophosphatase MutT (NUDIX family)
MLNPLTLLRPYKMPFRHRLRRSAVAIVYRRSAEHGCELLFIERARRHGDPWSGDMGFPGGKMQATDVSAWHAAVRETAEETGIDLRAYGLAKGRLQDLLTRRHNQLRPMVVTPYLFELRGDPAVVLNHEVQSVLWVPYAYLCNPANRALTTWHMRWFSLQVPCYYFSGKCIWGLSFQMVQDLLGSDCLDGRF